MKITEQSQSVLVLKSSGIVGLIIGVLFVIVGGVLLGLNLVSPATVPVALWIPIALMVAGLLVFLFSKSSTITFSKDANTMTVMKSGMTGKSSKNYPLDSIAALEILEEYRTQTITEGNNRVTRPVLYDRLRVVMKDGGRVELYQSQANTVEVAGMAVGTSGQTSMVQQVSTFLGVPLNRISAGVTIGNMPPGGIPPIV